MNIDWILAGSLPRQPLEEVLEPEMARQYRLVRGAQCKFVPVMGDGRWLCSCGEENESGKLCACGLEAQPLTRALLEELSKEAALRMEKEAAEKAEADAKAKAEARAARRKKLFRRARRIATVAVCLVLTATLASHIAGLAITKWIPQGHYEDGLAALKKGNYQLAYEEFAQAGDYKDAPEYLEKFYVPATHIRTETGNTVSTSAYTYDEAGYLLTTRMELYEDGVLVEEQQWSNTYSPEKLLLTEEDFYGKSVFTYNAHGDPLTIQGPKAGGNESSLAYAYRYDAKGRLTERLAICTNHVSLTYSYEMIETFTYDEDDNVLTHRVEMSFPASSDNNYISQKVYTYEKGLPVRLEETVTTPNDETGSSQTLTLWTYDGAGRQLTRTETGTYPNDPYRNSRSEDVTEYDSRGNQLKRTVRTTYPNDSQRDSYSEETYTYNDDGQPVRYRYQLQYGSEQWQALAGRVTETTYVYDYLGRLSRRETIETRQDGKSGHRDTYTYDGGPVAVSSRNESWGYDEKVFTSVYTYNAAGLVAQLEDEHTVTEYTYAWFYDPEGIHKD